jgi:hypothetical protein
MPLDLEPIDVTPRPANPTNGLDLEFITGGQDARSSTNSVALPPPEPLPAAPGWWEQNVVNPMARGYQNAKANLGTFVAAERAGWINQLPESEYQRLFGRPADPSRFVDFPLNVDAARRTMDGIAAGTIQPRPFVDLPGITPRTPLPERLQRAPEFQGPAEMAMRAQDVAAAIPSSPAMQDWQRADGVTGALGALARNPVSLPVSLMAESAAPSALGLALGAVGSLAGPGGTALGAGAGSFGVEAMARYAEALAEANGGRPPETPEDLAKLIADRPMVLEAARNKAVRKGLGVAAFDAITAGLAGRFVAPARGWRPTLKAAGKELALQAGGGMAGEVAGETLAGDPLSARDILAEGIAELPGAAFEGALNWREYRGERVPAGWPGAPIDIRIPEAPIKATPVSPESDFVYSPTPAPAPAEQPFVGPPVQMAPEGQFQGPPVQLNQPEGQFQGPPVQLQPTGEFQGPPVQMPGQPPFIGPALQMPPAPGQFQGPPIQLQQPGEFQGPPVQIPPPAAFQGPPLQLQPTGEFQGPPVQMPAAADFQGPTWQVPGTQPFVGPPVQLQAPGEFQGPPVQMPAAPAFQGPPVQMPTEQPFVGPPVQVPTTDPYQGPAWQAPAPAPFVGPTLQVPAPADFQGPPVQVQGEPPFVGPPVEVAQPAAAQTSASLDLFPMLDLTPIPLDTQPVPDVRVDVTFPQPGKPVSLPGISPSEKPVQRVPVAEIAARPDAMQFKRSDNTATGENAQDALTGKWNDLAGGNLLLWEPIQPSRYGLTGEQKYIVANGHHRLAFGQRQQVDAFNAQVIREADGYSVNDARRIAAEINIMDGKGTVYDQAKFLRNIAATHGEDEALAARGRLGARSRPAQDIAFLAGPDLYDAFVNHIVQPDAAAALAAAAPRNEVAQRIGIRAVGQGKGTDFAVNLTRAAAAQIGDRVQQTDLFAPDDPAFASMERQAEVASREMRAIREQIAAVSGAVKRPEVARQLGVDVRDPAAVAGTIAQLKDLLRRWESWPADPQLRAITLGQAPGRSTPATPRADSRQSDFFAAAIGKVDELQSALRGKTFADPFGLTALLDLGLSVIRAALQAGATMEAAIRQAVSAMRAQEPALTLSDADLAARLHNALQGDSPYIRARAEKLLERADLPEATRHAIDRIKVYQPISTAEQDAAATEIIRSAGGPETIVAHWDRLAATLPAVVKVPLWVNTLNQLIAAEQAARQAGDTAVADRYDQLAARFAADRVIETTTQAQSLRMLGAIGRQTPAGWETYAARLVARAAEAIAGDIQPAVQAVGQAMQQANAQGADALPGDARVQQGATQLTEATVAGSASTQAAVQEEVIQTFGPTLGPIIRRTMSGQTAETLEQQLQLGLGITPAEAARQAAEIRRQWTERITRIRSELPARIRAARSATPPASATALDQAIRRQMQDLRMNLGDIVRRHYTEAAAAGQTIAAALVKRFGVPAAVAEEFARVVQDRFAKLVEARKRALLGQLTGRNRKLAKKSVADRIIEFSNLGAFEANAFSAEIMRTLKLPQLTPEARTEIRRRATELQVLPEGSIQRQTAQRQLTDFIARQSGASPWDIGWSAWYAHILSGPETHVRNTVSNVFNLLGTLTAASHGNPLAVPRLLAGAFHGVGIGAREAMDIMRHGSGAQLHKFKESGTALELISKGQFRGASYLRALRYVGRALAAADALVYFPAHEAKAYQVARTLAKQKGLHGAALEIATRQMLGETDAAGRSRRAQIAAQLDAEAMALPAGQKADALWRARREEQLVQQARPEQLREEARQFALQTTYNGEPYGLIGVAAGMINNATRYAEQLAQRNPAMALPAVAAVTMRRIAVPFTNIVANVTNEMLNYTPWAFARLALAYLPGRSRGSLNGQPVTTDAALDLATKGAVGTLLLGAIAAKAAGNLDDDDGDNFQVYGAGPKDKNKRDALRETGWIPHSVRIGGRYYSFQSTPMALGLAVLGNYLDASRYSPSYQQADALNRTAFAIRQVGHVLVQQSFIDGLAKLLGAVDEPGSAKAAGDRALEVFGRGAISAAIPNLLRQVDKWYDPTRTEASGITGALLASVPFAHQAQRPALNALGEPIVPDRLAAFSSGTRDNLWQDLAKRGVYPSPPEQGLLTGDEYYQLLQLRGQILRPRLATALRVAASAPDGRVQAIASQLGRQATAEAKARLHLTAIEVKRRAAVE